MADNAQQQELAHLRDEVVRLMTAHQIVEDLADEVSDAQALRMRARAYLLAHIDTADPVDYLAGIAPDRAQRLLDIVTGAVPLCPECGSTIRVSSDNRSAWCSDPACDWVGQP